ncbi:hypothetical protein CFB46_31355 [Burkholderia sp. HI2761]|nr:hypothetical protein CFB46_31355 [Burkholderia sp. HI2761]
MLPGNGDTAALRAGANGVDDKTVIGLSSWRAVATPGGGLELSAFRSLAFTTSIDAMPSGGRPAADSG